MKKLNLLGMAAGAIVAIFLLFAFGAFTEISSKFFGKAKVKIGDSVKVEYTGSFENGTIFDSSQAHGQPLEFKAGAGQIIKGFDEAVIGMEKGEEKTIKLQHSEAYGEYNPQLVVTAPRKQLPEGKQIAPGMIILATLPDGQQTSAIIVKVNEENFTIDLNHPLAGKTLIFKIKVVDIS